MDAARRTTPKPTYGIFVGGVAFRTLFIIALAVLTARVAMPQIEKIWSVFETPDDLIRVALGACLINSGFCWSRKGESDSVLWHEQDISPVED